MNSAFCKLSCTLTTNIIVIERKSPIFVAIQYVNAVKLSLYKAQCHKKQEAENPPLEQFCFLTNNNIIS